MNRITELSAFQFGGTGGSAQNGRSHGRRSDAPVIYEVQADGGLIGIGIWTIGRASETLFPQQ